MWPTDVREITSPYGWRTHPIFGSQRYHSGIDIGADYGDTVVAADGGVVAHADWYGGYGKAVIIDHGNGLVTLYAHNSQLLVSEGQTVRKGEAISRLDLISNALPPRPPAGRAASPETGIGRERRRQRHQSPSQLAPSQLAPSRLAPSRLARRLAAAASTARTIRFCAPHRHKLLSARRDHRPRWDRRCWPAARRH